MNVVSNKYIPAEGKGVNNLRVDVYYSLGGVNMFTYKNEPRGYWISVTPVHRSDRNGIVCESTTMFKGIKQFLKEVSRQSKKSADEAIKLAEQYEQKLIEYVCCEECIKLVQSQR